jgi:hypothetical protein
MPLERIDSAMVELRGLKVMLDADLAVTYGASTRRLKEQVRRNLDRFPEGFMFELTPEEKHELAAKCDRFSALKHSSSRPYAFTEHGTVMVSAQSAIYNLQSEMPRGRIGFGPDDNRTGSRSDFIARDRPQTKSPRPHSRKR